MKAHDTAELFFEDVRLPKTALLGGLNKGFYHLMTELPQERLQIGITGEFSSYFDQLCILECGTGKSLLEALICIN